MREVDRACPLHGDEPGPGSLCTCSLHYDCGLPWVEHDWSLDGKSRVCPDDPTARGTVHRTVRPSGPAEVDPEAVERCTECGLPIWPDDDEQHVCPPGFLETIPT